MTSAAARSSRLRTLAAALVAAIAIIGATVDPVRAGSLPTESEPEADAQAGDDPAGAPADVGAPIDPQSEANSAPAYVGAPYFAPGQVYTENFPDPSVVHDPATGRYHAFSTTTGGVNVPTMWSTDGRTWTARSNHGVANPGGQYHDALPWPLPPNWPYSTGDPDFVADLWAPGVGKVGNRWVMFYSLRKATAGQRCLVYATSDRPDGPYADPREIHCSDDPMGSVDPQPFTDPATGTTYLVWTDSGRPGSHGQRIWARPIVLTSPTTVAFTGQLTFLLESAPGWEQYVAENPSLVRLPDGTLTLFYSGNQWVSHEYATGTAVCSGFGFAFAPRCTRTGPGPYVNHRAGRSGIGGMTITQGPGGELLAVSHSWAAHLPAGYTTSVPSNQRRMSAERLHQVDGRLVLSGPPGPTGPAPPAPYRPRQPERVLDTRDGLGTTGARYLEAGEVLVLDLSTRVPDSTTAAVVNLTVISPARSGFVTAFPCGRPPDASNVNVAPGTVVANLATVRMSPERKICLYTDMATHLAVDLQGTYDTTATSRFTGVAPTRILDTRHTRRVEAGETIEVPVAGHGVVPTGADAVAVNLTATNAAAGGWLTAWPCTADRPWVSNVNHPPRSPAPNAAIVSLSTTGSLCVYALTATEVVIDVFGYTSPEGNPFTAITPTRIHDSRSGGSIVRGGQTVAVSVIGPGAAPPGTESVVLTLTATQVQAFGWVAAYPCSAPPAPGEETSNLNVLAAETRAAHVTVPVGADGTVCLFTLSTAHLIVDLSGGFGP